MRHIGPRWKLIGGLVLAAFGAIAILTPAGVCQPNPPPPYGQPGGEYYAPPQPGQEIVQVGAQGSPLDPALHYLSEAKQAYQNVRDYTCLFIKRERVKGELQPENVATMKVRSNPFSVYMHWQAPHNLEGQEVCYVAGKNNGMMRAHSTGVLGFAGWVGIDPNDPRALANSRHTILEAGIGNLIDKYTERWEHQRPAGKTQVKIAEYEFAKRRCIRIEAFCPNSKPGECYSYRGVVYFDKELKLPIRSEAYDWPRQGGAPGGDLLEVFSYVDLKLNVGLSANDFNY
jgi:Protein of unknown function (DUF1571)